MGARINFVFKDSTDSSVVLYSHWGQTDWQRDIAMALEHAKPRWTDTSYATRMMISYLMQDSVLEETGFGIYAIHGQNYELGEETILIDFTDNTVVDVYSVAFEDFINAYAPKVYAEIKG